MLPLFKVASLMFLFCCVIKTTKAQDIIIKNDKTEIKSKVTEITETTIKYKKWDNADGPVYNLLKSEVFMIIYENGQRETIRQPETTAIPATQVTTTSQAQKPYYLSTATAKPDTAHEYRAEKVEYEPARVDVSLQAPLDIGASIEVRMVKNIFNLGFASNTIIPEGDYGTQITSGFLYGSFYAPLNRLVGNYEKQNKGLFAFAHLGYSYTSVKYEDYNGNKQTLTSGDFNWRAGLDFYFLKGFGVTVSSYKLKNLYAGIVFQF